MMEIFKKREKPIPDDLIFSLEKELQVELPEAFSTFLKSRIASEESISLSFRYENGSIGIIHPYFKDSSLGQHAMSIISSLYNPIQILIRFYERFMVPDNYQRLGILEIGDNQWPQGGIYIGVQKHNYGCIYSFGWENEFGGFDIEKKALKEHFLISHSFENFVLNISHQNNPYYQKYKHKVFPL